MKLAMIGLGRMGGNMTQRLCEGGHEVVAFDRNADNRTEAASHGATPAETIEDVVSKLESPRVVWLMVPAGEATENVIDELADRLEPGDVVVDGGNSNFRVGIEDGKRLAERRIGFVDAGTSGGIWGLKEGYCLMVGGDAAHVKAVEPALETLAPPNGWAHVGPVGAGHFVKMVHNGIEYGMMQAFAEGFELMESVKEYELDLHQIAEVWRQGSVVRSWLLDLAEIALRDGSGFDKVRGYVDDSGEGRWTIEEAINASVPLPVITASLFARFASRQDESFAARINAALRNQFGGHSLHLQGGETSKPNYTPGGE